MGQLEELAEQHRILLAVAEHWPEDRLLQESLGGIEELRLPLLPGRPVVSKVARAREGVERHLARHSADGSAAARWVSTAVSVYHELERRSRIREGSKERIQTFTGTCIARKGSGNRETSTVRRIVQCEGVERVFPLHSPNVESVKVVRRGRVRRAKLHYPRQRAGRATRCPMA